MRMWKKKAWRIVVLAVVIGLAAGIGVTLNAYYHARASAARNAAEAQTLGAKLDEARRAQELTLTENRELARVLGQTAEDLEDLQTAQQLAALEDRMTSQTLQQAASDLEKLQAAQQGTADQSRETSQSLDRTAVDLDQTAAEFEKLQAAQQSTLEEYRQTVEGLQDAIAQLGLGETPMESLFPGAEAGSSTTPIGSAAAAGGISVVNPKSSSATGEATQCPTPRSVLPADAALHARILVWKYLGQPGYSVFTVTRAFSAVSNLWHVAGQFAPVGGAVREYAASVRYLANGKWLLLSFQWMTPAESNSAPCCSP